MSLEAQQPPRPLIWPDSVLNLQEALLNYAGCPPVYIVGGAVRDAFRHYPVHDLDLATPKNAIALGRWLANSLQGDIFVLDRERDVARVLLNAPDGRLVIDIAAFRGADLLADLSDRDFTLNAIAVDLLGDLSRVIDPLNGVDDLQNRVIRRCSPHALADDPIRVLRAVRQSVQLSARIEPITLADIRAVGPRLIESSPERIRDEFFKILSLDKPASALRVAHKLGLLGPVLPALPALEAQPAPPLAYRENAWQYTLAVLEKLHTMLVTISPRRNDQTAAVFDMGMMVVSFDLFRQPLQAHIAHLWPNERSHWALLLLGALLHSPALAPEAEKAADALRLSNDEKSRLVQMVQHQGRILHMPAQPGDLEMHRFWYALGETGVDVCLLTLAVHLGTVGNTLKQDVWVRLLEQVQMLLHAYYRRYDEIVQPPPLVNGRDLMNILKLPPGKRIGQLLDHIREGQVMGQIKTTEDALQAARAYQDQLSDLKK